MDRQVFGEFVLAGGILAAGVTIWRFIEWALTVGTRYYTQCVQDYIGLECEPIRTVVSDRLLFDVAPFLVLALVLTPLAFKLMTRPIMTDAPTA